MLLRSGSLPTCSVIRWSLCGRALSKTNPQHSKAMFQPILQCVIPRSQPKTNLQVVEVVPRGQGGDLWVEGDVQERQGGQPPHHRRERHQVAVGEAAWGWGRVRWVRSAGVGWDVWGERGGGSCSQ